MSDDSGSKPPKSKDDPKGPDPAPSGWKPAPDKWGYPYPKKK
jgi:hypothetical protein